MVYIENITEEQTVRVPVAVAKSQLDNYTLVLRNTETLQTASIPAVDSTPSDPNYYALVFTLPARLQPGEYTYRLTQVSVTLAGGLLRTKEKAVEFKEYNDGIVKFVEVNG